MRQSFEGSILFNAKGEIKGVNLGYDFCAEHEWGCSALNSRLGIGYDATEEFGYQLRKVTKGEDVIGGLVSIGKKQCYYICAASTKYLPNDMKSSLLGIMQAMHMDFEEVRMEKDGFLAGWNERGFHILFDERFLKFGADLLAAIHQGDALVYIGSEKRNPFSRDGLRVIILSREDESELKRMAERDEDKINLLRAAHGTGIHELLKKAGKKYYALSPAWADDAKSAVKFWLNPMEQRLYRCGWYTVDELKLWAEDKGPIVGAEEEC